MLVVRVMRSFIISNSVVWGLVLGACAPGQSLTDLAEVPINSNAVGAEVIASSFSSQSGDVKIWPQVKNPIGKDLVIEKKIDKLIAKMNIAQKVGQLVMPQIASISPDDVARYHIGSVLSGGGAWPTANANGPLGAWMNLAGKFYGASMDTQEGRLAIPVMWGIDAVHGHNNVVGATLFPHNIGLGAGNNPALVRDIATATAREVAVTGIDWTFAPTIAVARDSRWGRTYESYSEDPKIVKSLGKEMVLGLQGHPAWGDFLAQDKVIATAKHFVGDGGTQAGDDQGDTILSEEDLYKIHGQGYVQALGVGVQTVMASFNSWNGDKLHGHKYLLTDVLKNRLGFDGLVVGDWNGHEQIPGCRIDSCPEAINAGVDIIMVPERWRDFYKNTIKQVKTGEISQARLDDAVRRILRVKFRAGMFEDGKPSVHILAGRGRLVGHADHRRIARQAVRESLVLLKNQSVLPLQSNAKIMLAGSGAHSPTLQTGGWTVSWQGRDNPPSYYKGVTTIFDGFKAQSQNVFFSEKGTYDEKPDIAIVVFGEQPYAEFEGDLADLDFDVQNNADYKLMQLLKAQGIKVVGVFLTGRPRGVDAAIELADAFVVAWLPGSEGAGIADVLVGDAQGRPRYNFKGKLPFTWQNTYPFGYGLGYGDKSLN